MLLGLTGLGLNLLALPLLPDLQLLFGAVPVFLVAVAYGAVPGAVAGAIAGARTVTLWGHPWGWLLLTLEAAAVGLLRSRLRPAFAVAVFWVALGFWLGMASYALALGVPWFSSTIAILKQVLNGLVNGLAAEALILAAPVRRLLQLRQRPVVGHYLGVLAALAAAVPLLALWVMGTRQQADAALGAAEMETRIATLLFSRTIAQVQRPGAAPADPGDVAALRIPGVTLRALGPDGRVLRARGGGELGVEATPGALVGAGHARRLVAGGSSGIGGYSDAGPPAIPFLRNYEQTLVFARRVPGTAWIVWAEMPFSAILAPLNARVLAGEVVMIAALLLALLLALLVALRLERPIAALMEATERLAGGDLDVRVRPEPLRRGPAEPVILAQRLEAMAARIKASEAERARLLDSERLARAEAERRAREEAELRQATEAVTESFTVEEVIRQIAQSALVALAADGAYVERIESERGVLRIEGVAGDLHPLLGAELPLEGSYAEAVLKTGQPAVIDRVVSAEPQLAGGMTDVCPDCAAVVLPLMDSGNAIGALLLLRREGWGFRPDEVKRAATFAGLASLAFRKVHLLAESEQRREELERVMESRGRLIRGFSHDVKNPLGAADGYLQLLEDRIFGELSPKQLESIGRVRRALHSALSLIGDLVELARAEAGQLEVQAHTVDVCEIVKEMAGEYRAQAEAAGLTLKQELSSECPLIHSDGRRIRQVLGNLISNAVKYTPEGGRIVVRVRSHSNGGTPGPGAWVAAEVEDTGRGIPSERRNLIFKEFTRLEPSRTPGAGLGLAISRRVARAIGGELTFVSEPGAGSTFTLWLPREPPGGGS